MTTVDRVTWLNNRRRGIGGSDAPVLMGHNPSRGPYSLYCDKTSDDVTEDDSPPSEAAYWGIQLEELVAREFGIRSGLEVLPGPGHLAHPDHPWMLGTPDRYVRLANGRVGLLECKTTHVRNTSAWEDAPPEHVVDQVIHYMAVTGVEVAWAAVLIGGQEFMLHRIDRTPQVEDYMKTMIETERAFWFDHVVPRVPPPVDGSTDTSDALNLKYANSTPQKGIELGKAGFDLLMEYSNIQGTASEVERKKAEIQNRLKEMMEDAELGMYGSQIVVTWTRSERRSIDTAALRAELPEVADRYTRRTGSRTFRVRPLGDTLFSGNTALREALGV